MSPDEETLLLNLGCGGHHVPGFVNVDVDAAHDPDVVLDLDQTPWPWKTGSVDYVIAQDVLEHLLRPLAAAGEIHRILAPGGRLEVRVPHRLSPNATRDWSHMTYWDEERIRWLADADAGHGLGFRLEDYWEEQGSQHGPWGNIHATYRKEGVR